MYKFQLNNEYIIRDFSLLIYSCDDWDRDGALGWWGDGFG